MFMTLILSASKTKIFGSLKTAHCIFLDAFPWSPGNSINVICVLVSFDTILRTSTYFKNYNRVTFTRLLEDLKIVGEISCLSKYMYILILTRNRTKTLGSGGKKIYMYLPKLPMYARFQILYDGMKLILLKWKLLRYHIWQIMVEDAILFNSLFV